MKSRVYTQSKAYYVIQSFFACRAEEIVEEKTVEKQDLGGLWWWIPFGSQSAATLKVKFNSGEATERRTYTCVYYSSIAIQGVHIKEEQV